MANRKNALIAGATGLIGAALLRNLAESGYYDQIYVLARKTIDFNHPDVIIHKVDFDQLYQIKENFRVDHVFCSLGSTLKKAGSKEMFYHIDHDLVVKFAEFGLEKGGSKFILVTAIGADPQSSFFYNRVKGAVEQSVAQLGYESVIICRPGILLGNRAEGRPLEKIGQGVGKILSPLLMGSLKKYKPIKGEKVAGVMIKAAQKDIQGLTILESGQLQDY